MADLVGQQLGSYRLVTFLGAGAFAMKLPVWRGEARQLVLAQAVAGGDPAQEMTMGPYESEAE